MAMSSERSATWPQHLMCRVLVVLFASVLMAGCADDRRSSSKAQYLDELGAILERRAEELEADTSVDSDSLAVLVEETRRLARGTQQTRQRVAALSPPAAWRDEHERLLSALDRSAEAQLRMAESLARQDEAAYREAAQEDLAAQHRISLLLLTLQASS